MTEVRLNVFGPLATIEGPPVLHLPDTGGRLPVVLVPEGVRRYVPDQVEAHLLELLGDGYIEVTTLRDLLCNERRYIAAGPW